MASDGSVLDAVLEEPEDEPLDEVPDVALVLELLSPVAPICDRASRIEFVRPPPGGGGGGAAELASAVPVTSELLPVVLVLTALLVLPGAVAYSSVNQLRLFETLLIVMLLPHSVNRT
jgi:hypothetical protein